MARRRIGMDLPWWREAILYQICPRSFFDHDGDGVGDLKGIADRLDHVASLGVAGIWLTPFFVSPMHDFGYDVANYRDVDPMFGSLADFDALVARAHGLGLKVLVDMVWGHSSDRHPWFVESRASRQGPRADWYVWVDPRPDGMPPNNWLSVFGGSAWSWEPRRRQYYLHPFLASQPKLNLRHPAVLESLLETGAFWLERGCDGMRLDAVDYFLHDPLLRDNPPADVAVTPIKPYQMQRHVHDMGMKDAAAIMAEIRALTDRYPGRVALAEVGSERTDEASLERAAFYVGRGTDGIHAAYSLAQMKSTGDVHAFRTAIQEVERYFPAGGMVWAFSNHDVARVVSRWGDGSAAAAKLFMALLLSLRGTALIYQGEELGLPEAELPYASLRDPYGLAYWPDFKGRDGARTPMPWQAAAPNAGFSTADETWLPVPEAHHALAVDRQERDPDSVLSAWRHFIAWRKQHPALGHGTITLRDAAPPALVFERSGGGERLLCCFNLSKEPIELPLPDAIPVVVHGLHATAVDGRVRLPGYGALFAHPTGP
jgi:alpha-glucosidase